jgi:hypothetical protein
MALRAGIGLLPFSSSREAPWPSKCTRSIHSAAGHFVPRCAAKANDAVPVDMQPLALFSGRWRAQGQVVRHSPKGVSIMVEMTKVARPGEPATDEAAIRARALKRLKKRRDFAAHLLVYLLVNSFLVAIWAVTSGGFFWPVFPIIGWGIGVVMNGWDVWRGDEFTEEQIAHEMQRIKDST